MFPDANRDKVRASRILLLLGAGGVPILMAGVLTLNPRLCITGAIISGVAAVLYAVLQLF